MMQARRPSTSRSIVIATACVIAMLAGCEAINVSRDITARPVRESVYDLDQPTRDVTPLNQPDEDFGAFKRWRDNDDPDAPWAAVRRLFREEDSR